MTPDGINAAFEVFGSVVVWWGCRRLVKDKEVRGSSWLVCGFFLLWGIWNLFYYPHLGQWLSFVAGISLTIAASVRLYLMLYYLRIEGKGAWWRRA